MPRWAELKRFLDHSPRAHYLRTTDHHYYLWLDDTGDLRQIKCSLGKKEIPPHTWQRILHHDLQITQEEFNAGK